MKSLLFMVCLFFSLKADIYYAKVEPFKIKKIASNVMGQVIVTDENKLGKVLEKEPFIMIDSALDKEELQATKEKIVHLQKTLDISQTMATNFAKSLEKKRKNYQVTQSLKIKSQIDKDREFYDLMASENSYLSLLKEMRNVKIQLADLRVRQANLEKSIADKEIHARGYVLYSLQVDEGDVVAKGTPLAEIADISKALLTLYLTPKDRENIENLRVYVNDKKTAYSFDRLEPIADAVHVSSYKAQMIIKAPKVFSKLVKIELKEE